jgi:PncC family amidohydrolase
MKRVSERSKRLPNSTNPRSVSIINPSLEERIVKEFSAKGRTLSLAESCTGGLIAHRITNVPGSSDVFLQGIVAYSNACKMRLLGVRKKTLTAYGALSEEAAREMAKGSLRISGSDWALSVTGIAGPGGGTKNKPVGTVWFAAASGKKIFSVKKRFSGSRVDIKSKSAETALKFLLRLSRLP